MYRIGIDVGGTNTDAVIMHGDKVLVGVKSPTTSDVMSGVVNSIKKALDDTQISADQISAVMIGTTHFTNAVVERRNMSETAAVRLCLPAAQCLPPMVDWPDDIREAVGGHYWMAAGGNEFDGREISKIDEDELTKIADEIAAKNIETIAICSVFSPVNDDMEKRAAAIMKKRLPNANFTLSSEIGRLGILERENAAIMNASLRNLSTHTVDAFRRALQSLKLTCPYFITQNDGTLMGSDFVQAYPVLTFASGPTNSMRGASFLTGEQNAIVADVGGTSTDVGALVKGFPRPASTSVDVGGVRTNFRMPDVFSIALGGGTIIEPTDPAKIGPKSVGYRIHEEGKLFGGNTLTSTDIAVGLGIADIGDAGPARELGEEKLKQIKAQIDDMITNAVERMRVSPDPIPVLAVGGGSILIPDQIGDLPVKRPENFAVANAVGAAIGQISGEVDRIYSLSEISRDQALSEARKEATDKAIAAGAKPDSIELLDQEDVPLAYLPGNATRIRLKVVGDLNG
ncbi:N-methylhydantoinase A/oxoprolinase/acetone carboxylase beta subunit [Maritalea mobilis]|uniref:N-methylhydantoinase A/oxoprolinase/acetone carboxylase beta subunit n=1 Tax=Maritalea mobilis TaxID=483324 RepID=A0A4R6VQ04_9HYPH|nr:hydantoinase/oxoprolinase family protein [Maritalea mobilis]TDQ66022.1 N-methylhydantoinase A/oxoprolinase/acetone carboxylase beta subunit [Maritalea mobilis]